MKKKPFYDYEKESGRVGFIGVLAEESRLREQSFIKYGCNSFTSTRQTSRPMIFWRERDVFGYILRHRLRYVKKIYGNIVLRHGAFTSTKETRTGCLFCMYGVHMEQSPNKFQRMRITHPHLWDYCINKLNLKQVLDYISVPYI